MALGGGYFTAQNKVLPGAYINFVSKASGNLYDFDRGIAAFGLELSWGPEGVVRKVTAEEFMKNSDLIFGYAYDEEKMKGLRDLFRNIKTLYAYRLNSGGVKAKNSFGEAKYAGEAGNQIKIAVLKTVEGNKFEVQTIFRDQLMDTQTVTAATELEENDFVTWKSDVQLTDPVASEPMTGGTDGTVTGDAHQAFLDAMESYHFHAMGTVATDETAKKLYTAYQIRMREEVGKKFQVVIYNYPADYEGVVNVKNKTTDKDWPESSLVYFTTGLIAGCGLGGSNTNKIYDGEFEVDVNLTQRALEQAIEKGEFAYHNVGDTVRVLMDLNSLVTVTDDKGEVFKRNETIRVIDEIATYAASIFTDKYLGKIRNDPAGRVSYQTDLALHHQRLEQMGAIMNFDPKNIVVSPGKGKTDVIVADAVEVSGVMEKLYMTCIVG